MRSGGHRASLCAALTALAAACAPALPPEVPPGGPAPGKLEVEAPRGAEIHVDGVFVGVAPLRQAVEAEPGRHRVLVTLGGHEPRVDEVELQRGEVTTLEAELAETPQRVGAWVAIGTGAASLGTGIVLGVLGVVEHRNALELAPADGAPRSEVEAWEASIAQRDRYRVASGAMAGVGLGVFLVGALLFTFDEPAPPPEALEPAVSAFPLLSPDVAGAAAAVRF